MMKLCLGSLLVLLPGASAAAAATQNVRSPPMVRRLSDRAAENLPARPLAIVPSLATIKTFEDGRATQYCMRRAAFATPRQLAGRLPVRSWDSDCAPRAPCALAGMELLGLLPCAQRRGRHGAFVHRYDDTNQHPSLRLLVRASAVAGSPVEAVLADLGACRHGGCCCLRMQRAT